MGGKSKILLAGVFCVSLSVGVASADSYTEAMESAAAALKSAKDTLAAAIADFEAREAAAAKRAAEAEAEAARAAAEAERLKAEADAAAAKKGKGVKAAAVDTAAAKKAKGAGAAAAPAVVDTAVKKAAVIDSARIDTAVAKAKGVDSAAVDTAAARAKAAGVDSAVVDTAVAKVAGVDSATVADTAASKAVAVDSAAVKPAPPKAAARPQKVYPIVKPDIEMVFVKGGKFKMGCADEQENCVNDERPRHEVKLKDYHIGKYPVTQKQWWSVMGVNPSHNEGGDLPVEQVSWDDVQEFIKRLNVLTGKKYRLPTEAEWEYAARGGALSNGRKFSGHPYLYDVAWYDYNSGGSTRPVGGKAPNELGAHDMLGNVWEWVGDWYDRYYYKESVLKNPVGPKYGVERVSRGCSFNSEEGICRVSLRNYHKPGGRTIYLGFRLASQ